MSPEQWIEKLIASAFKEEAERVEAAILAHFGTAERAQRLAAQFPGRFTIERRSHVEAHGIFVDAHPRVTYEYRVADNLAPTPDPRSSK